MKRVTSAVAVLGLCLGFAPITGAAESAAGGGGKLYGDAARGRAIVEQWCVACHKTGPVIDDQIPSLASLAANPLTDGAIRAFLMNPHRPMPPLAISSQQIEDILAHLRTLKQAAP